MSYDLLCMNNKILYPIEKGALRLQRSVLLSIGYF